MLEVYKEKQESFYNFVTKVKKNNKVSHAYLIETHNLSYGYDLALSMAKYFLCDFSYTDGMNCSSCNICKSIDDGNYLDIAVIDNEVSEIKKEQMLDLQKLFSTKPVLGKYKIYIIKNASLLNKSSANAILKFLEEPSEGVIAILLTSNINSVMTTIVSRCQIISLNAEFNIKDIFSVYCSSDLDSFYDDYSKKIVSFYESLESMGTSIIAYKNSYVDTSCFKLYLEYGLYFYYDVLRLFYDESYDTSFLDIKKKIVQKSSINDIIYKIDVINKFILDIKYNVNIDLFIDSFIISFGGDSYD